MITKLLDNNMPEKNLFLLFSNLLEIQDYARIDALLLLFYFGHIFIM